MMVVFDPSGDLILYSGSIKVCLHMTIDVFLYVCAAHLVRKIRRTMIVNSTRYGGTEHLQRWTSLEAFLSMMECSRINY